MTRSLRSDVWAALDGRCTVEAERVSLRGFRYTSRCQLCGLDSGPWGIRLQAAISSLLHLEHHHPNTRKECTMSTTYEPSDYETSEVAFAKDHAADTISSYLSSWEMEALEDGGGSPLDLGSRIVDELIQHCGATFAVDPDERKS